MLLTLSVSTFKKFALLGHGCLPNFTFSTKIKSTFLSFFCVVNVNALFGMSFFNILDIGTMP